MLRDEQVALAEETAVNETLGESVAGRVKAVAKLQEANKFKTHVQEVGHITSLLLSLSGRLARAENALLDLSADHPEKVNANKNNPVEKNRNPFFFFCVDYRFISFMNRVRGKYNSIK